MLVWYLSILVEDISFMKVIVAGGRDFSDYDLMCEKLDFYLKIRLAMSQLYAAKQEAQIL